ncbi:MAG: hypothetical protein M1839_002185 [Geoglossum umbratile]|nr:MAG: hypothetical protein M1839_002185 [Geoglossum umbratile]
MIVSCRVRVRRGDSPTGLVGLSDCLNVEDDVRRKWVVAVAGAFGRAPDAPDTIRAWDFVLNLDGTVGTQSTAAPGPNCVYPIHFRAPQSTLAEVDQAERAKRAEQFAFGSLVYEIMTNRKPFEGLTDEEIDKQFSAGEPPDDILTIPAWPMIYLSWGIKISDDICVATGGAPAPDPDDPPPGAEAEGFLPKIGAHIRNHPVRTTIQVVGGLAVVSCMAAPAILMAVGFTAAGPAAGTAAAAWQASIGLVEAGSFFAWCQSAAMGGAAVQGIIATGVAGAGVAGGATFAERAWGFFRRAG